MSKPDTWMPFAGNDFFSATRPHPPETGLAYLKALWHYWHHNHCRGLPEITEYLRRICEVERDSWEATRSVVFDNVDFFTLGEDGLWHQKRCDEEWKIKESLYRRAINGGLARSSKLSDERRQEIARKGAKARWK
jgi:uncharacterized protein YdaU (DUF1376 family)